MNEIQQLSLIPDGTPEQAQAVGLHYEIVAAAQAAANSLLALGRKLKQMRDTGGYKRLGFESFADYTEQAVGIRQRQAYNYISVVENVPARLVEENAAAGVTKLALLGRMAPADQEAVAGQDLAHITVAELKKLVEERNGLSEQLSMLQDAATPAAEAESTEVDMEALRAEALEQARAEVKEQHAQAMRKALQEQGEKLAADRKAAELHAAEQAKKEAKREAQEQLAQAKAEAAKRVEAEIEAARQEAAEAARREQEEKDHEALESARRVAEEARTQAEETARKLQLATSEESIRFALLFEQLQGASGDMMDLIEKLNEDGRAEEATKLRTAMTGALKALIEQLPGDHHV